MPIKRSAQRPAAKAEISASCASCRGFWKWFLFVAMGTALVVLGYVVAVMFQHVLNLTHVVNSLSGQMTGTRPDFAVPDAQTVQYKETGVGGLFLAYQACQPTFTGLCDDAGIYRLSQDGSKEMLIKSVRSIAGAPQTNELLQPLSASPDGKILVLGAWAFGSNRNANDKRVWLYDLNKGAVVAKSAGVPADAIFSPDYAYAAYAVTDNNDIRDVMIVSFISDKTVSGAKADEGRTFKNQNGTADLVWKDAKTLAVTVYSVPSGTEASSIPVKVGEKTIKLK